MVAPISGAGLKRQVIFWLIALGLFVLFLLVFSDILLPFIAGMALAYFLDPVADRLERWGLSRLMATIVILIGFVILLTLSLMIVIPLLATQAAEFFEKLPGYITDLQAYIAGFNPSLLPPWISSQMDTIKESFSAIVAEGAGFFGAVMKQVWNSGMALINIASLFVITPVVAFYLLLDWDRMIEKVDRWVPRDHVGNVRRLATEMNVSVAGFVRGQGSICIILGLFYGIGLSVAGLNFGLLIGLFAGLISFIPYVGSLVGLVLSVGVALVQFWPEYWSIILVAGIFFIGQFIEGNILQPKLVGSRVGLHPVWLMFALVAFGAIFGFVGLMVAVPAAAAVGVLVRFALERYLDSDLYYGSSKPVLLEESTPGGDAT
jgi:predicted PurR-regulated permease PerM